MKTQALLRAQAAEKREAIREAAARLGGSGGVQIPMPAVLAAAAKPGK